MMEDDNIDKDLAARGSNPPSEQPESQNVNMKIVGYNILALIIYTLLCRLGGNEVGLIFDAFIIVVHVFVCIIAAIINKSWAWLLSGILVLVIGFSTCVGLGSIG
ncbi:hypothetical protein AB6735_26205 [Mucilaginibacter sp. RCC_168]|uniref:hypothetical protein n=1 Tax=Mucilaginibacter sp. RCC_168 TaxID=3239221 RepID=UPI003524ADF9